MEKKVTGNSLIKQAAILAIAGLLVRLLGFLYRLPLTNLIGNVGNAIYSAGYYIYTFMLMISSAGLPIAISKLVAERIAIGEYKNAHRVFKVSLIVAASVGSICMLLLFAFAENISIWVNSKDSVYSIMSLAPTVLIVAIMAVFRGYFQGMNTMTPTAVSQIVEQIFNAIFSVLLAYLLVSKSVAYGAAGGTMGTGIGAFFGLLILIGAYFIIRPDIKRKIEKNKDSVPESSTKIATSLFAIATPIIIGTAIFSVTNIIDMKMVLTILTDTGFTMTQANNLYGQLSGKYVVLTNVPAGISTAIATAIIPSVAATIKLKDFESANEKINKAIRISMILSFPAGVGLAVLGDPILKLLFPAYPEGGILLQVGGIAVIFLSLYQVVTGTLQGIGKVYLPIIGTAIGAIFKIVFNYILLSDPKINIVGAVLSTMACYFVASIINLAMLINITKVSLDIKKCFLKPLICSLLMGVAAFSVYYGINLFIESNAIAVIVSIIFSIFLYLFLMIFSNGLVKEDIVSLPAGGKIYNILKKIFAFKEIS